MTAHFFSRFYDSYEGEAYNLSQSVELTSKEVAELKTMTPKSLIESLKSRCVGICNTVQGDDRYYIPVFVFGGLRASLQVNYYVWSHRFDNRTDNKALITSDEFDAVCNGGESLLDVAFSLDGSRICLGQMKVREVCDFFNDLVGDDCPPILDSEP